MKSALIIITWLICGVIARCLAFAFAQGEFSFIAHERYKTDWWGTWILVPFGPATLAAVLFANSIVGGNPFKHGLRFK